MRIFTLTFSDSESRGLNDQLSFLLDVSLFPDENVPGKFFPITLISVLELKT